MTGYCTRCGTQNLADAHFCASCGAALSPLPPSAVPVASAPPAIHYAGFWIRFVAVILDAIAVEIVVVPLSFIVGLFIGIAGAAVKMPEEGMRAVAAIVGLVIGLLGSWLYEAFFVSSSRQATPGKMIFGLQVTGVDGSRLPFGKATLRHLAKYLSGITLGIGYIMAGFSDKKQGLHDTLVGTIVRYR